MYRRDRHWETGYVEKVRAVLRTLVHHCVRIVVASSEKDMKEATDFNVEMMGLAIAVRLRRPDCRFRDLTIRADRSNGAKTELAKITEGFASRYFYGWIDDHDEIAEWILVDLDKMRDSGLFTVPRKPRPNRDGTTSFVSFSIKELIDAGCLLESQLNGATSLPRPSDNTTYKKTVKQTFETIKTTEIIEQDSRYWQRHLDWDEEEQKA